MSRLDRWSRLKRGESLEDPPSPASYRKHEIEQEPSAADHDDDSESSDKPGSLDHTLPDPDTLPPGSDIKAYMVSGVSAGLRKRALRRLFSANHYGFRDGLDDYDDDYRERLKPLASEVAERLRHWTRRQVEGDDERTEEAPSEAVAAREHHAGETIPDAPERAPDTDSAQTAETAETRSTERPADHRGAGPM
ncbi:DUF3306 domain-containing protein [Halomonas aquatica]|uniref:DUF3306 domain-containing protein n=1 Tax=Halomonas aquatica TaxID=3151123 RepID=A0ABV1NEG3_9GAMM